MFGHQPLCSAIAILVFVKVVIFLPTALATSYCSSPATCIELKKCEPYMDLIHRMEKPLQLPVSKFLKARMCGFEEDEPKVCCFPLPRSLPSNLLFNKQPENRGTKEVCQSGFKCVDLTQCSPLVYLLNLGQPALKVIKSQQCGFREDNARVCCKIGSITAQILPGSVQKKETIAGSRSRTGSVPMVHGSLKEKREEINNTFDLGDFLNLEFYDLFRRKRQLSNSSNVNIEIR